jgi:xanthine dehydrogenase/oxidase
LVILFYQALSFYYKFSLKVFDDLKIRCPEYALDKRVLSAMHEIERGNSSGTQVYQKNASSVGVCGTPVMHSSGDKQLTGQAMYVDDIPKQPKELYGVIVYSTVAHGIIKYISSNIRSVNTDAALSVPGVVDYISNKDLPPKLGSDDPNMIGAIVADEELFASREVHFMGQMIGFIVAETEAIAREASRKVQIEYEILPAIFTTEDAIESNSFFEDVRKIESGCFSSKTSEHKVPLSEAKFHVEGTTRISAQEHFYLETQGSLAVPGNEDDEIEIFASTQNPRETQEYVAQVLGIPENRVVVRVKRLGGGFGGKETKSVFLSCAVAIASKKLGRPVRCILTREEDMIMTGTRHPFVGKYRVGFTESGLLVSLDIQLYANGGYSHDLSVSVLERSLTHCDNSYRIPNVRAYGRVCRTNTPSNTAFRGFGGPQGMYFAEQYITHVAEYLGKPVEEIRV